MRRAANTHGVALECEGELTDDGGQLGGLALLADVEQHRHEDDARDGVVGEEQHLVDGAGDHAVLRLAQQRADLVHCGDEQVVRDVALLRVEEETSRHAEHRQKGTHVLCIPITLDHSLDEVRLASSPLYEPTLYSESVIPLPSASVSMSTVEDSHIDSSLVSRSSTCFICPLRCTAPRKDTRHASPSSSPRSRSTA